jgi:hypothetical protein
MRTIPALIALLIAGCDPDPSASRQRGGDEADDPPTSGLAFERHIMFVGGSAAAPMAAIFDLTVTDHGSRLERTALSWLLAGDRWLPLLNATWAHPPMREPWRLVPHGPLSLVADEAGDVELVHRGEAGVTRLRPGVGISQWSAPRGREVLVRRGEIVGDQQSWPGSMLEFQFQRRSTAPSPEGAAAFLTDGGSLHVVLFDQPGATALWLRMGEDESAWHDLELTGHGTSRIQGSAGDGAARLDLTASTDRTPVGGTSEASWLRGSLQLGNQRHAVFGLLRASPP